MIASIYGDYTYFDMPKKEKEKADQKKGSK